MTEKAGTQLLEVAGSTDEIGHKEPSHGMGQRGEPAPS
jgi:hypothetical protein